MTLSDLSIKNPVFAVMLSAAMIVFGYLGYRDMGVSQFPEIDFPVVSITITREAASPDIMDGDVTDVHLGAVPQHVDELTVDVLDLEQLRLGRAHELTAAVPRYASMTRGFFWISDGEPSAIFSP